MWPETGGGGVAAAGLMPGGGGWQPSLWRTPTPYLFLGVAAMMAVIVVALLVLLCTRRRTSSRQLEGAGSEKASPARGLLAPLDREAPMIAVIMAGERAPSFLASAAPLALATSGATAAAAAAAV
ncbi:unnamed protein product [Urochloa humidicola]